MSKGMEVVAVVIRALPIYLPGALVLSLLALI
jgi:hypothetical protein